MSVDSTPLDQIRGRLLGIDLSHAAERLPAAMSDAVKKNQPVHELLASLLGHEHPSRAERRLRTSITLSSLPPGRRLSGFDYGLQPGVDRRQPENLATCGFIRDNATPLLPGPPGVGKTHLAVALGVRAFEQEFNLCPGAYVFVSTK